MGCTVSVARDEQSEDYPDSQNTLQQVPMYFGLPSQVPINYNRPMQQLMITQADMTQARKPDMDPINITSNAMIQHLPVDCQLSSSSAKAPSLRDNIEEAAVVAGSITAFTNNLTGQTKQDILNAVLYAQIKASQKYSRTQFSQQWYQEYKHVLLEIGFAIGDIKFNYYTTSSQTLKIDDVVTEILKHMATPKGTAVIKAAMTALGKLPEEEYSVQLFETQSANMNLGNFQVCVTDQATDGKVILTLGGFDFRADRHVTRFLWHTWATTNIFLLVGTQTMVFDEQTYASIRQKIANWIGSRAQDYITGITLV